MRDAVPADRITVVPTGVDLERFRGYAGRDAGTHTVVFLGSMDWEANVDGAEYFCREIWPDILRRVPTAHDCPDATWWGAACDVAGRRALTTAPVPGLRAAGVFDTAGFEVRRWRSAHPVRLVPLHGKRSRLLLTPVRQPTEP